MAKVRVLRFKRDSVRVGEAEIDVYRLEGKEEKDYAGELMDLLISLLKEERSADYVIVEHLEGPKEVRGGAPPGKERRDSVIFPKMTRLKKVAVVRRSDLKEELGYLRGDLSSLRWSSVGQDVYVFDGKVRAPPEVFALLLETEDGIQLVTPS